ncbi:sigma-70 family RNA polymerase sigma factor [Staphylococcus canis]|uniref:Sigma-70 family RNA polymerase sigma factor n=1 Tax=Staphylococcus canis TaxID=2724942 RepID=A0ABS0TAN6_9STAP|nr:sigma-70 family RNA polymerase sigma factor [Staphylococcus canis]MBI5975620.1 sigma-70 family RNA polymerase sigma factor [Staphylococcus canis]
MTQFHNSNKPYKSPYHEQCNEVLITYIEALARKGMNDFSILSFDYEDLVQEAIWGIYQKLKQKDFHQDTPIDHYINKAVRMRKVDYRRQKLRHSKRYSNYVSEQAAQSYLDTQRQPDQLEEHIRVEEIMKCINKHLDILSPFEIKVFNGLLHEWSPSEIANELKVQNKKVYNAIYRIRNKLKKALIAEKLFDN